MIRVSEWVLEKIPFVTQIYSAAKQIGQAIDPRTSSGAFQECVLIKHPRHGEYALAFVTGECRLQVHSMPASMNETLHPFCLTVSLPKGTLTDLRIH